MFDLKIGDIVKYRLDGEGEILEGEIIALPPSPEVDCLVLAKEGWELSEAERENENYVSYDKWLDENTWYLSIKHVVEVIRNKGE